jgi:hypothetical protein
LPQKKKELQRRKLKPRESQKRNVLPQKKKELQRRKLKPRESQKRNVLPQKKKELHRRKLKPRESQKRRLAMKSLSSQMLVAPTITTLSLKLQLSSQILISPSSNTMMKLKLTTWLCKSRPSTMKLL